MTEPRDKTTVLNELVEAFNTEPRSEAIASVAPFKPYMLPGDSHVGFADPDEKVRVLSKLREMGVYRANVTFCGSGDSGSIDDAAMFDKDHKPVSPTGMVSMMIASSQYDGNNGWKKNYTSTEMDAGKCIVQITEAMLDHTGIDWYNNDGGQGELNLDLTGDTPVITLDVSTNYTQTDDNSFDF